MSDDIIRIAQALDFAARRHVDQRRKGIKEEPYVNHLAEVALLLAEATGGKDTDLVIAGLLHDTIEDQAVSRQEIAAGFGGDVAGLVVEATDDKSLPKEARKRLQVENAPRKTPRAKLLKIADKISNLRSLINSPPAHWTLERRQAYLDWAEAVVAGCRGGNEALDRKFDETLLLARDVVALDP